MRGRFNIPMTEYYIEGNGIEELERVTIICSDWLEEQGFQFKQYTVMPHKRDIIFQVIYYTPAQFQVDAFTRNLTNNKF